MKLPLKIILFDISNIIIFGSGIKKLNHPNGRLSWRGKKV